MFSEMAKDYGFEKPVGHSIDDALLILRWADSNLSRGIYTYYDFKSKYGKCSAIETLKTGKINFYVPCFDLCSVMGHLLQEQGFPSELILYESHSFFEHRAIHSRLQFKVNGEKYRLSTYRLGTSYYPDDSTMDPKHKPIKTISFSDVDYNKPILEYAVKGGIENMSELIPGFSYTWLMLFLSMKNSHNKFKQTRDGFNRSLFDSTGIKKCLNSTVRFIE
jgi:hypothetical protein